MNKQIQPPTPAPRARFVEQSPELVRKLSELNMALSKSAIEQSILDLVAIRSAQLNGCAFCLDMHVKQAKIHGERELRIYHLNAWRESELFAPRERAALGWTDALTRLGDQGVPDAIYDLVRSQLSEKELSDLSFAVAVNNAWNRLSIGFRTRPGSADSTYGLEKAGLK